MNQEIAFGIDLAGYSTGKSGFAKAERVSANQINVVVYKSHAFSRPAKGQNALSEVTSSEIALLKHCLANGKTLVDMPLDLQDLLDAKNTEFVWQLTKRPVDLAFTALPPLADKIGSPVARIRNLLSKIHLEKRQLIRYGENLFETYPAGSLELLGMPSKGYKNQNATFIDGEWQGETLAQIASAMKLQSGSELSLNDDDVDAAICALSGLVFGAGVLEGENLKDEISTRLLKRNSKLTDIDFTPPIGYRLISSLKGLGQLIISISDEFSFEV